jgi:hypothetical protein
VIERQLTFIAPVGVHDPERSVLHINSRHEFMPALVLERNDLLRYRKLKQAGGQQKEADNSVKMCRHFHGSSLSQNMFCVFVN